MMMSYVSLMTIYFLPIALFYLAATFGRFADEIESLRWIGVASPLMTLDSIPMTEVVSGTSMADAKIGSWVLVQAYFAVTMGIILLLSLGVMLLFVTDGVSPAEASFGAGPVVESALACLTKQHPFATK